jgi:hypothetical protein
MIDLSSPFFEYFKDFQNLLEEQLIKFGVERGLIAKALSSGYYMLPSNEWVFDSYYSPSWAFQGQMPFGSFVNMLVKNETDSVFKEHNSHKVSYINSVDDIYEILNSNEHSKYCLKNGSLSFRGQRKEYTTKRPVPNSYMSDGHGNEKLIIPGLYRKYSNDFQQRIVDESPTKVFQTFLADDLIYYGIDKDNLHKQNFEKYGQHNISDLEDFPEKENQEYYKRWVQLKVQGSAFPDIAIVSQHYGFETYGLDITFKPKVAAFFATNYFNQKKNGKADFVPIKHGEHIGVIYCFYFRAPQLKSTRDIIKNTPAFEYINPLRPIRQECALPFFLFDRFNEANQFIYHEFRLNKSFDTTGIPSKEYLFPSPEEDKFYEAALNVKRNNKIWSNFVEYEF